MDNGSVCNTIWLSILLFCVYMHISSVESQKGTISSQRYFVENQLRALSLYKVYGDSALLVLNGSSLNGDSALLALN